MADNTKHAAPDNPSGLNAAAKVTIALAFIGLAVPGLIAWGSTSSTVADQGRRIAALEDTNKGRDRLDQQTLQRLTAIETKVNLVLQVLGRRDLGTAEPQP